MLLSFCGKNRPNDTVPTNRDPLFQIAPELHLVVEFRKYEKGFTNHYPVELRQIDENDMKLFKNNTEYTFEFEGVGFVLRGRSAIDSDNKQSGDYDHLIELYIDNELSEIVKLPTDFTRRRNEICWKYNLKKRNHVVKVKLINPENGYHILLRNALIYDNKPG